MRSDTQTPSIAIVQRSAAGTAAHIARLAWGSYRSEWGGVTWGKLYSTSDGGLAVWIAAMTPGQGSGSAVAFEMDPASYVIGLRMLRDAGYPDDIEEVGLWHSHPGYHAFLSSVDEEYFRLLYPQLWKVSVVLDPINNDYGVFAKNGQGVELVPSFLYAGNGLARVRPIDGSQAWEAIRRSRE